MKRKISSWYLVCSLFTIVLVEGYYSNRNLYGSKTPYNLTGTDWNSQMIPFEQDCKMTSFYALIRHGTRSCGDSDLYRVKKVFGSKKYSTRYFYFVSNYLFLSSLSRLFVSILPTIFLRSIKIF